MSIDLASLQQALWPHGSGPTASQAYLLLDGARDERIASLVRHTNLPSMSLYSQAASSALRQVGPYLVQLAPESTLLRTFVDMGWGQSWGGFVVAGPNVTLSVLREHFRRFLRVEYRERRIAFRFYDPRVLKSYAKTSTDIDLASFFGPIERFLVEPDEGAAYLHLHPPRLAPKGTGVPLPAAPSHMRLPRIGRTQMAAMEAEARERFLADLKRSTAARFPTQTAAYAAEQWHALAATSVQRAMSHGLNHPDSIKRYFEYVVLMGEDFHLLPENDWIGDILADDSLNATEKISWIESGLTPQNAS